MTIQMWTLKNALKRNVFATARSNNLLDRSVAA